MDITTGMILENHYMKESFFGKQELKFVILSKKDCLEKKNRILEYERKNPFHTDFDMKRLKEDYINNISDDFMIAVCEKTNGQIIGKGEIYFVDMKKRNIKDYASYFEDLYYYYFGEYSYDEFKNIYKKVKAPTKFCFLSMATTEHRNADNTYINLGKFVIDNFKQSKMYDTVSINNKLTSGLLKKIGFNYFCKGRYKGEMIIGKGDFFNKLKSKKLIPVKYKM